MALGDHVSYAGTDLVSSFVHGVPSHCSYSRCRGNPWRVQGHMQRHSASQLWKFVEFVEFCRRNCRTVSNCQVFDMVKADSSHAECISESAIFEVSEREMKRLRSASKYLQISFCSLKRSWLKVPNRLEVPRKLPGRSQHAVGVLQGQGKDGESVRVLIL